MHHGYLISAAAQLSGFTVSALRFYEKEGVVVPDRTPAGYRRYSPEDMEALRFVARAKCLGLSLPEITELLALLQDEDCRPVQSRMRQLVTDRIGEAQHQIADLVALTAQLQQVSSRLGLHTPDGACDDQCGCRADPPGEEVARTAVPLVGWETAHISCSLEPHLVEGRTQDWKATAASARSREALPDGTRLWFGRDVDVASLSRLAAAEQDCCGFFTFTVGIHPDAVSLDVTGPADAQAVIAAMFGSAA